MNLYYGKIKELMNNYQDLILENQMVLDELEQECQEKINENTPGSDCALTSLAVDEPLEYARLYLDGNLQMWVNAEDSLEI